MAYLVSHKYKTMTVQIKSFIVVYVLCHHLGLLTRGLWRFSDVAFKKIKIEGEFQI